MGRADQVVEVMIARWKAGRKRLPVARTLSGIFRGETAAVQRHRLQTVVVLPAGHDVFHHQQAPKRNFAHHLSTDMAAPASHELLVSSVRSW
jgi:hypothetical protein